MYRGALEWDQLECTNPVNQFFCNANVADWYEYKASFITVVTVASTVAITISHIKSLNYSNSHIELTTAGWTAW